VSCIKTASGKNIMIKNYFKIAWRNLVKNKVYSALNILGLASGMAVALLIGLWVYYQYSFDRFLPGYKKAYQVMYRTTDNGVINTQTSVCFPLADVLKREIPGIKYVVQSDWMGPHGLVAGNKKLYIDGTMAGSDFLKTFEYPLLKGNANTVLHDTYSIVLTQSTAKSLFGDEDPIGKTVRVDNRHDVKVTGILKDLPSNSSFQLHFIIPFSYSVANEDWVKNSQTNWGNNSFQTFVALDPHVTYAEVEPRIRMLLKKYNTEDYKIGKGEVFMHPMKDWHLYSGFKNGIAVTGFIEYVKMFSIIGILVLLIACINFMNLSTARSEKRAKEVGIRKAIGSQRNNLIFQFLVESIVITFAAFIFSLGFVQLALPTFNTLTKSVITIPYSSPLFWIAMMSYVLITGLLAGSRPAFYLSSFNPVQVLKGTIKVGKAGTLPRKILVVLQFTCSIALVISTIIVYQQIQYAKARPTGYNTNRLMITDNSYDLSQNYQALKQEMLQSGVVSSVTKSSSPVTAIYSTNNVYNWEGKLPGESLELGTIAISDTDYFKTLGLHIVEGKNFFGDVGADSLCMIINEAAVKRMRFKQALNQSIDWGQTKKPAKVIAVVNDALMESPFASALPTYFMFQPSWSNCIMYRLSPEVNTHDAITKLTLIFNKYNPSFPYQYRFADENYASKFDLETLIGKLAGIFATLAIFISCLGLFGLAAYTAEQRTKEIGIRKVLGASISQVWLLLSKDFIGLVIISCVIATPVSLYSLQGWLIKYDYRITIGPGVFILSAILAMIITVATVSFQAIKAGIANPVKSLKTE
jgi:putative ABC transport system permease protein